MIWKISLYLLFVALPATVITSVATPGEPEGMIAENVYEEDVPEGIPTDGALMGSIIAPDADDIEIIATNGEETISGTTKENGEFFITGFEEGMYKVIVEATKDGQTESQVFQIVDIVIGEATAIGTVTLEE